MSLTFQRLLLFLLLSIFTSCATQQTPTPSIKIFIDSYGDETRLLGKKYYLLPYDSFISSNYLLYEELAQYIYLQLNLKGYTNVSVIDSADCIIFLDYGISDPKIFEKDIYLPVYGQTGVSSVTVTGSADLKYYPGSTSISYSQRTTYTPTYGRVGTETINTKTTYYSHYMILSLFDKNSIVENFNKSLRWKLITKLDSESSDLRMKFPYLVSGSRKYIGKNSYAQVNEYLRLDDPNLAWLRKNTVNFFSAYAKERALLAQPKSMEIQPSVPLSDDEILINKVKVQEKVEIRKYNSISEATNGDVVLFYSSYGDPIYGLVDTALKNKISITTYPTPGQKTTESISWKLVSKVSLKE